MKTNLLERTRAVGHGTILTMILAITASVPHVQAQPTSDDEAPERVAREFVEALIAERFEAATKAFDPAMQKALPPPKLAAIWRELTQEFGTFKSLGERTRVDASGYRIIYWEAAFERAVRRFKVVVDAEGKIAGFFHEPSGRGSETAYKPPTYDKAETYSEREIAFGTAPWTLKGKLTQPRTRAIVPAVVLVHGSGPHDEDESIGPNKPFRDLAAGLSSRGIAVLRYQKRTHAHALKLVVHGTITVREEVVDDALAALAFLRAQPGIDPSKVYVLGHSLGATLAPCIATEEKKIAGAILLAGTGRDFYDVLDDQLSYIASLPGPQQHDNRRLYASVRKEMARLRTGADPDDVNILNVPASYWNELNQYATRSLEQAASLKCRLFIANGGRDYQITRKDFNVYRKGLGKRKNVTLRWYENLNHLFMPGKEKATPAEFLKPNHVAETPIRDLHAWISAG